MSNRTDAQFVWEGLRLKAFSFVDTIAREAAINSAVLKNFSGAKVEMSAKFSNDTQRLYTLNGTNLFVAYSVIELGRPIRKVYDSISFTEKITPTANIGNDYTVEFKFSNNTSNCSGSLELTNFNKLDNRNMPSTTLFDLWCSGVIYEDRREVVYSRTSSSEGHIIDELILKYVRRSSLYPSISGTVKIERTTIPITILTKAYAPGW